MECREDCVLETPIVFILHIDDRFLPGEELRHLLIGAANPWKVFVALVVNSEDFRENHNGIFPDEVGVA